MANDAETRVSNFYNTVGWETDGGITEDAKLFEDLRECAEQYVSKCRLRVLRYIPLSGDNLLDMASGPIQYKEYLEFSRNFNRRYCVDLSISALSAAKNKIGDHGVYLHGSFLDIILEESFFDCTLSLHTIYHIDRDMQEAVVRKLVKVTKEDKPVIIVYGNPNTLIRSLLSLLSKKLIKKFIYIFRKPLPKAIKRLEPEASLYFYLHPLDWWNRFNDVAHVKILPWRSFDSQIQKKLFPDNRIGSFALNLLFCLEETFPSFFTRNFQYPIIILTKRGKQQVDNL